MSVSIWCESYAHSERNSLYATKQVNFVYVKFFFTINNKVSAWLDETEDVILDDFDPDEDDSEGDAVNDNPDII